MKKLLELEPPIFKPNEILSFLHQTSGLKNIKIHPLPSDRDQIFLLTNQSKKFVLKIYNYKESLSYIKMQIAALEHIAKSAFSYSLSELIGEINQVKKDY